MTGAAGERRRDLELTVAVVLAAVIAYATATAGVFVYDDIHSIAANPGVHSLANAGRFFVDPSLFSGNHAAMYRPVLLLTLAFDWFVGGGEPLPFKATNVLLHALASGLLVRLVRAHGASRVAAAVAGVWFAVHPLASETINLVSARSESLLVVGLLVALSGHREQLRGRRGGALAVFGGCVVACGSKETGVVVPVLLLVQEWLATGEAAWPALRARWRAVTGRLWPAAVVVATYLLARRVLLGIATASVLGRRGDDPMFGASRDLTTQLATMGVALPRMLLRVLWPADLSIDVPLEFHRSLLAPLPLLGWSSLALASFLVLRHGRSRPLSCLGLAIAWLSALPWIVLPLNVPLAEHRLYGCLLGFAVVLAGVVARGASLRIVAAPGGRRAAQAAGIAVAVGFAVASGTRSWVYRDEVGLWRAALAVHPTSARAHWALGVALRGQGDAAGAAAALTQACALYPEFRVARSPLVEVLLQLPPAEGWPYRALVVAEELARQKDSDPYYRLLHARALFAVGALDGDPDRLAAAEARVLSILTIAAPKMAVYRLAAQCRLARGDGAGALDHFDAALAAGFDAPALRAERSEALALLGRNDEADRELRAAQRAAPFDDGVRAAAARRAAAAPR